MKLEGNQRVVKLRSAEMDGEIFPERDLLSSEISVTSPDTGSHEIPEKLHGDSDFFQESKTFNGSLSCFLNSSKACVSTFKPKESGKSEKKRKERNGRNWRERKQFLAIGEIETEIEKESFFKLVLQSSPLLLPEETLLIIGI